MWLENIWPFLRYVFTMKLTTGYTKSVTPAAKTWYVSLQNLGAGETDTGLITKYNVCVVHGWGKKQENQTVQFHFHCLVISDQNIS